MASNPPIDAVPDHLRTSSNPADHIQRYLAGSRPFLYEFVIRGREHIDRALKRDEKREQANKDREARDKDAEASGSTSWDGSTVTGRTSARSSGIVRRMRRKDGSLPGETDRSGEKEARFKVDQDTVVVLKRSEIVKQGQSSSRRTPLESTHRHEDKENIRLDAEDFPTHTDKSKPSKTKIDLPTTTGSRPKRGLAGHAKNELEAAIIQTGLDEVDMTSMTSSARRESPMGNGRHSTRNYMANG